MTTIANVLCPVDLSEVSRLALRYAVAIARAHDARLRVLQVVDSGLPPMANGPALFELSAEARASLDEELNWFVAPVLHTDVPTEVHLREGKVVATILDEAATLTAPLIVIGTHGRGGFERFALGSVAEKVLRKASCPVLAVPPHISPAENGFRRVLVATDFSEPSERALSYAELVAVPSSANVFLVHVLEWPFGDTSGPDPVTALRQSLEAEANDRLTALAAACRARLAERVVLRGKPSREIVEFARARQVDLIVLGVSGRGALDLALLGSTARQVLHDAPCPVLTVTM
jgi:nucleotide-binding universal stress UspA family protein